MRRNLPPLTTLEGFEAAARLGSFSAAAEALNLTQSAISHQIRQLEEALGQPVFRRLHRSVVLTDAGRDFQRSVAATLDGLRDGVARLAPYKKPGSIIVYCDSALANGWLARHLPDLKMRHPRIDMWLDTTGRAIDFARDEVDIHIKRYPVTQLPLLAPDLQRHRLFDEILRPLASPAVAAALRDRPMPSWQQHVPLLHEEGVDGWSLWFESTHAGISPSEPPAPPNAAGPYFSDGFVMLQAAAAGSGIALGCTRLAASLIADGRLSWLAAQELPTANAYFIAASTAALADPDILATFNWIRDLAHVDGCAAR